MISTDIEENTLCFEDGDWQVICENSLFSNRVEQLGELCQREYNGDNAKFVQSYLRPVLALINSIRSDCEEYYKLKAQTDEHTWLQDFENIVTYAIHPSEIPVELHKGDFFIHISATFPLQLQLKYVYMGKISTRELSNTDHVLMCSPNWTELLRSDCQDRFVFLHCVIWAGKKYERVAWNRMLRGQFTGLMRSDSDSASAIIPPLPPESLGESQSNPKAMAVKPLLILDLDFELLHSGIVFLPGGRDKRGGPVIVIDISNSYWQTHNLDSEELTKLLMYFYQIPRESAQIQGCSLVIDAREGKQTKDLLECIGQAITLFQTQIPGSVYLALVLIPKDSLLPLINTAKVKGNLNFQFQFVSTFEKLLHDISAEQLPESLGGSLMYDHERWIKFRTQLEPFMAGCRSAAKHAMGSMSELSRNDYGYDVQTCQILLEDHKAKVSEVLEDERLCALKSEGQKLIERISSEVYNEEYLCTDDYRDTLDCVTKLYGQMNRVFDKLKRKSDHRTKMLDLCLSVLTFNEESDRVISWILKEGLTFLQRSVGIGDSFGHAQSLMEEFMQFSSMSKECISTSEDQIISGRQLVMCQDLVKDHDLLQEKLDQLEYVTTEFNNKFHIREKRLNKCLDFHTLVQQASHWQMQGLQYIAHLDMEDIQTEDGIQRLKASLQEYISDHPPITESQLARITELAHFLGSKNIKLQAEQVSRQCLDVQEMLLKKQCQVVGAEQRFKQVHRESLTFSDDDENSSGFKDGDLSTEADEKEEQELAASLNGDESQVGNVFSWKEGQDLYNENDAKLAVFDAAMPAKLKTKLAYIIQEMIDTEHGYVESLEYVLDNYLPEMDKDHLPATLKGKRNVLFGNIERIFEFHKRFFSQEIEAYLHNPLQVGKCFLKWERQFYLYALYNKNKPRSDLLWDDFANSYFQRKLEELCSKLDLASYLIKPVQRLGKYSLLLRDMISCCDDKDPRAGELKLAQDMIRFQLRHGNDLLAMDCIKGADVNLKEQGCLLRQADFIVWYGKRKRFRRVFLFEHLIAFTKPKKNANFGDTLMYKHSIKMADLGLTENIGETGLKFEVWYRRWKKGNQNEAYVLQASMEEVKSSWTKDITRMLWRQARQNKEYGLTEMSTGISVESTPSSIFSDTGTSNSYVRSRTMDVSTPKPKSEGVSHKRLSWLSTGESSSSSGVHDLGSLPEDCSLPHSPREEFRSPFKRNDEVYSSLPKKLLGQNSATVIPIPPGSYDVSQVNLRRDVSDTDPMFIRNNVFRKTLQMDFESGSKTPTLGQAKKKVSMTPMHRRHSSVESPTFIKPIISANSKPSPMFRDFSKLGFGPLPSNEWHAVRKCRSFSPNSRSFSPNHSASIEEVLNEEQYNDDSLSMHLESREKGNSFSEGNEYSGKCDSKSPVHCGTNSKSLQERHIHVDLIKPESSDTDSFVNICFDDEERRTFRKGSFTGVSSSPIITPSISPTITPSGSKETIKKERVEKRNSPKAKQRFEKFQALVKKKFSRTDQ